MQAIEEFLTTWAAAEQAGDTTTLETQLASDFTAVGPLGFILAKQAWLARHRIGDLSYQAFSLSEVNARTVGGTAIVTARSFRGGRWIAALRRSTTSRGGEWTRPQNKRG